MLHKIFYGDNLEILKSLSDASIQLIYIDPPFNTGRRQSRQQLRTEEASSGDRIGFQGKRYSTEVLSERGYQDKFDNYLAFLEPRLRQAYRLLAANGSIYFHIDYREVHYCKILLDKIFGRAAFLNEIIWAYDYGGRTRKRWPAKHDNILWYAKDPKNFIFNYEAIQRIPYMAPGLVSKEKAERGKLPTDTWWHTIVGTNSREKTGYPTQKPLGIIRRIVQASSHPGNTVLDFFAGSGTVGAACYELSRQFILIDNNIEALQVMAKRFQGRGDIEWVGYKPRSEN
ncbi:MAG: site-specific DNA-methyltransferase [Anaerolineaceae bacterium]|nr:site-specific DNA-methyltransferase [Anaerolineaceae bacterium]